MTTRRTPKPKKTPEDLALERWREFFDHRGGDGVTVLGLASDLRFGALRALKAGRFVPRPAWLRKLALQFPGVPVNVIRDDVVARIATNLLRFKETDCELSYHPRDVRRRREGLSDRRGMARSS